MRAPKPKAQISYAVTAQLISTFDFVTRILQFLSYLNPKFKDNPASLAVQSGLCQTWSETPINHLTNDMLFVNLNKIFLN